MKALCGEYLETFVGLHSPNIQIRRLGTDSLLVADTAALRRAYAFLANAPKGFGVDVTGELVTGCFVMDHERFRAVNGQPAREAGVAIYQIEGRLIRRVWLAYP